MVKDLVWLSLVSIKAMVLDDQLLPPTWPARQMPKSYPASVFLSIATSIIFGTVLPSSHICGLG